MTNKELAVKLKILCMSLKSKYIEVDELSKSLIREMNDIRAFLAEAEPVIQSLQNIDVDV